MTLSVQNSVAFLSCHPVGYSNKIEQRIFIYSTCIRTEITRIEVYHPQYKKSVSSCEKRTHVCTMYVPHATAYIKKERSTFQSIELTNVVHGQIFQLLYAGKQAGLAARSKWLPHLGVASSILGHSRQGTFGILRLGVGRDVPEISSVFGNHFDVDQTLIGVRLKLKRTIGC